MPTSMAALVYEGPKQMTMREVPIPTIQSDEVLVKVAYSGICGSELSGYEGKNSLRKPPLIMGHEFSGTVVEIGEQAGVERPDITPGTLITANPLIWCGTCRYCLSGHHYLCPKRKLLSASLPGSNAEFVAVRAEAILVLPDDLPLTTASLTEPAACALHAVEMASPRFGETALVAGAGPIGLLIIQALTARGVKEIYCADLNLERLAVAEAIGATSVKLDAESLRSSVDIAFDAVGISSVRQACVASVRPGGRVIWVGLHEAESPLPINDMIRREIASFGSFAYSPLDFRGALDALIKERFYLKDTWTRIEPLANGAACFEELLHGSSFAKIWLTPTH